MKSDISVIILAAGSSSRMGKPKFLLEIPNNKSFLENITSQYARFGCKDIVVVLNNEGIEQLKNKPQNLPSNTQIVLNSNPEHGRFSSIKVGAEHVKSSFIFIHNIDNPIVNLAVLKQMYNAKTKGKVIKPVINNRGGHPILVSKYICDDIVFEKELDINLKDFLKKYSMYAVEVTDKSILLNINTKQELLIFLKS